MNKLAHFVLMMSFLLTATTSLLAQKEKIVISEEEKKVFSAMQQDTISIADVEGKYEIVIIEPGFYAWLNSIARPEGYYSQHFMENRNELFTLEWNRRVLEPMRYDPNIYVLPIDYDPTVNYGYDVNYKLYNYFIYVQRKYKQQLSPYPPRI